MQITLRQESLEWGKRKFQAIICFRMKGRLIYELPEKKLFYSDRGLTKCHLRCLRVWRKSRLGNVALSQFEARLKPKKIPYK